MSNTSKSIPTKTANLNISLPAWMKKYVEWRTETDGYANISEYVRHLIRESRDFDYDAELERDLLAGLASPIVPFSDAEWDAMHKAILERNPTLRPR